MSNLCVAQNQAFRVIFDQINPLASTDYPNAKKIMKSLEKHYVVDPAEKLLFLGTSLENDDITYFKSEMKKLMKNNGYKYARYDVALYNDNLTDLVNEKGLRNWMFKKSERLYPKWIKKHPKAFETRKRIDEMMIKDQMRGSIYTLDSICSDLTMQTIVN